MTHVARRSDPILVADLYADLERDYLRNANRSIRNIRISWKCHLKAAFAAVPASDVTGEAIDSYIAHRQRDGARPATINRELSALQRAYTLAVRSRKIAAAPFVPKLKERNVRQGFLTPEGFVGLAREAEKIGVWMRALVEAAYTYGWRRSELLQLRVRQVDLLARTIRLEPGTTKNNEGREVSMTDTVYTLLAECVANKAPSDFVFTRPPRTGAIYRERGSRFWWISYWHQGRQIHRSTRTQSEGQAREILHQSMVECSADRPRPVSDFRKDWAAACSAAGCPELIFHDLRRSAVRRLVNAGTPEQTAMRITGHRTRSVFDRYFIRDQSDLDAAIKKLESGRRQLPLTTPDPPPEAEGKMPRSLEVADLVKAAASGNLSNELASQLERWITFLRSGAGQSRQKQSRETRRKAGRLSVKGG